MKKLIVCATFLEAEYIIKAFSTSFNKKKELTGFVFYPEKNHIPHILVTGIGKTNSALMLSYFINNIFHPSFVLNTGIAGAFSQTEINIGDVVIASEEIYGDEGVTTKLEFKPMKTLGFPLLTTKNNRYYNEFPINTEKIDVEKLNNSTKLTIKSGKFLTVSQCTGSEQQKTKMTNLFNPVCESMEGAAVLHTCIAYNIPFAEIRGISNYTGNYDKTKWDLKTALANVSKFVKAYFETEEKK